MQKLEIRKLTEMGIGLALAVILNYLKLYEMPQGGSISLEMIPIVFIALRWSLRDGVLLGAGYGLLQAMLGGFIVHWAQLILDYPVAYALLGLAGIVGQIHSTKSLAKNWWLVSGGVLLGGSLRFLSHFIAGAIFFGEYAPKGQSVWVYSAIYNSSYLIPETIITIVVMLILIKSLTNNSVFELGSN